jgi:predicted dinucleotide-utilizing enzyme
MKLKYLLNEASSNPKADQLIKQLVDMSSNGELDADQISDLNRQLLTARRKWFASKKSSDDRQASATKAKTTIILKKASDDAHKQVRDNILGIGPGADAFALSIGKHRDKELQKKYNKAYNELYQKLAAKTGITDKDAIENNRNSFIPKNP